MTNSIKNGSGTTSTGIAQIVIAPNGNIRPVLFAVHSGYRNNRGTYQLVEDGDIIFCCSVDNSGENSQVSIWKDGSEQNLSPNQEANLWSWLRKHPQTMEINQFLDGGFVQGRVGRFLPAGIGWDGKTTLADKAKENRIRKLFSGAPENFIKKLLAEAKYSAKHTIPTKWDEAQSLPEEMDFPAHQWSGALVDIGEHTVWAVWDIDNNISIIEHEPTEGRCGSNRAGMSDLNSDFNSAPLKMDQSIQRAAKITLGAFTRDHVSYGVAWTLFSK